MSEASPGAATDFDVVLLGGAFAGSATTLLLRRFRPETRVLIVEQAGEFDRKVGEATVEISAFFLHKVLGCYDFLAREQLPKHGLRYWFTDGAADRCLGEMTEVGPRETPRLPSFQLDRGKMDQHLLERAGAEGAEVLRPAKVTAVDLRWPVSRVEVELPGGEKRTVTTRWVLDATGRHAFLARRLRLHKRVEEHSTAALWGRWHGVLDLDGVRLVGGDPRSPRLPSLTAARRLATNHFCGRGWWCWFIPLQGGQTSVGVVFHKEMVELPGANPRERYLTFLRGQAGIRELLAEATFEEEDFNAYSHLPYRTDRYADRGWALLGDAAAFIDPYYSPGLDHVSMTAYATARLVDDDLAGRLDDAALGAQLALHNGEFQRSYDRWLHSLYVGKYELFGDARLTATAFYLDTALYYLGVVRPVTTNLEELRHPMFGKDIPPVALAFRLIRGYNRRLQRLARWRRERGIYGRQNTGWRAYGGSPGPGWRSIPMLWAGVKLFGKLEVETLWARLTRPKVASQPVAHGRAVPAEG